MTDEELVQAIDRALERESLGVQLRGLLILLKERIETGKVKMEKIP